MLTIVISKDREDGSYHCDIEDEHHSDLSQYQYGDDREVMSASPLGDIFKLTEIEVSKSATGALVALLNLSETEGHGFTDAVRALLQATLREGINLGKYEMMPK